MLVSTIHDDLNALDHEACFYREQHATATFAEFLDFAAKKHSSEIYTNLNFKKERCKELLSAFSLLAFQLVFMLYSHGFFEGDEVPLILKANPHQWFLLCFFSCMTLGCLFLGFVSFINREILFLSLLGKSIRKDQNPKFQLLQEAIKVFFWANLNKLKIIRYLSFLAVFLHLILSFGVFPSLSLSIISLIAVAEFIVFLVFFTLLYKISSGLYSLFPSFIANPSEKFF